MSTIFTNKEKFNESLKEYFEKIRIPLTIILIILIGWLSYDSLRQNTSNQSVVNNDSSTQELRDKLAQSEAEKAQLKAELTKLQAGNTTKDAQGESIPGKININTATAAELDTLPGIGQAYAQRIIDYREQNGAFESSKDLMNIKGIGEKTFAKLEPLISL